MPKQALQMNDQVTQQNVDKHSPDFSIVRAEQQELVLAQQQQQQLQIEALLQKSNEGLALMIQQIAGSVKGTSFRVKITEKQRYTEKD